MQLWDLCFEGLSGYIEMASGGVAVRFRHWHPTEHLASLESADGAPDEYFGPALRREPKEVGKRNCVGSQVCWVDLDTAVIGPFPLQPTASVWSGHGWHLYWRLADFVDSIRRVEEVNRLLAKALGGDSAHNVDRLLRVPGSLNTKREPYAPCKMVSYHPESVYSVDTLAAIASLDPKMLKKIVTGDRRGYPSRSERDWAIVRALVAAGCDDATIQSIFETQACGDKYRDPRTNSEVYLSTTIKHARETVQPQRGGTGIQQHDNCYFVQESRGVRQVSTFTFTPTLLLEGDSDSLVGDIRASSTDFVWKDIIWPRSAFTGLRELQKQLTKLSWAWMGSDRDVRELLPYLMEQLEAQGIPRACAVTSLGRHNVPGDPRSFFVATNCTIASDGSVWTERQNSPLVYVPTGREAPEIVLREEVPELSVLERIVNYLVQLNRPECLWPVLGWTMATPLKPVLRELQYRFPILNVTGTRGSGKSTLLLYVMNRLLGVTPASYNSGTTNFVTLSLLGASNAVPVSFSEFRSSVNPAFLRYILLAYDTGRDARGRPDQTTVPYPLSAPFTLDGEDRVDDAAALERVLAVTLSPSDIAEGSPAWAAYQQIRTEELELVALPYLMHTLSLDAPALLDVAEQEMAEEFEAPLPARIRSNLTVGWFGVRCFLSFLSQYGIELSHPPSPALFRTTLDNVYSTRLGRAPTAADSFVEVIVNAAAQGAHRFPWEIEEGVLWFQLTPAFEYYVTHRAHQRQATLSRDAIKQQMRELVGDYTVLPGVRQLDGRRVLAYGIDLPRAYDAGIDVPEGFSVREIRFKF